MRCVRRPLRMSGTARKCTQREEPPRELGKKGSSCGGKGKGGKGGKGGNGGKKGGSCDPWECENGKLNNNGWDYDGTMAKTADGRTCQKWTDVWIRVGGSGPTTTMALERRKKEK